VPEPEFRDFGTGEKAAEDRKQINGKHGAQRETQLRLPPRVSPLPKAEVQLHELRENRIRLIAFSQTAERPEVSRLPLGVQLGRSALQASAESQGAEAVHEIGIRRHNRKVRRIAFECRLVSGVILEPAPELFCHWPFSPAEFLII